MNTKSTKEVAHILNFHPSRIEQWISRGQFLPTISAEKGLGRAWSFEEVMRLTLFVRLVDLVGMEPKIAGELTKSLTAWKDDATFFVAYHAEPGQIIDFWGVDIVRARDLGAFLTKNCPLPGLAFEPLKKGAAHIAVIVALDEIEAELREAWEA